jgi:hypothetical protein
MSPLSNLWRQLVERRLWPVAVLLIAALAGVPLVLAKEPEAEPAPAPQAAVDDSSSSELATEPIVALATGEDRAKRRKVLGKAKNPFAKPAESETSSDSGATAVDQANDTAANAGGGIDLTIGGGGSSTPAPSGGGPVGMPVPAPAPTEPDAKPVRRERHSVTVRFGDGDALDRMNVQKLEDLPLGEEPLVVYLGVADGGKSAVFLIDSSVKAEGDGECMPDPNTCETIHLSEGETEFFDVLDENGESIGEYQLNLIEIHGGKKRSSAGRTASAKGSGPGALQDRADTAGVARTADAGLGLALPLP